jgi:hypothetical protein
MFMSGTEAVKQEATKKKLSFSLNTFLASVTQGLS